LAAVQIDEYCMAAVEAEQGIMGIDQRDALKIGDVVSVLNAFENGYGLTDTGMCVSC
jgi:hypothetical protein